MAVYLTTLLAVIVACVTALASGQGHVYIYSDLQGYQAVALVHHNNGDLTNTRSCGPSYIRTRNTLVTHSHTCACMRTYTHIHTQSKGAQVMHAV